jgi:hypothetical protein
MSNNTKYDVYRCPDPKKVITDLPWYPISNVCPCNPNFNNVTGRGYTPCGFGVQTNEKSINYAASQTLPPKKLPLGALYQMDQYVPPQLNPYPLTRIGQQWFNPS